MVCLQNTSFAYPPLCLLENHHPTTNLGSATSAIYDLASQQLERLYANIVDVVNALPCLAALALNIKSPLSSSNYLHKVPLLILCSATADASSPLEQLLTTTHTVSAALANLNVMILQASLVKKIPNAIENYQAGNDSNMEHLLKALLTTGDDIQTILTPFTSIITSIRDAFAEEALSRFQKLAEIMEIYKQFLTLQELIPLSQTTLQDILDNNKQFIASARKGLQIDLIEKELKEFKQQEAEDLTKIETFKLRIQDANEEISTREPIRDRLKDNIEQQYLLLNENPDYSDVILPEIQKNEQLLTRGEQLLEVFYQRVSNNENLLREQTLLLEETRQSIAQLDSALTIRQENLNKLQAFEQQYSTKIRNAVGEKIQELKDLAQAKYQHLRMLLDQANSKFNQNKKEDL